MLHAELKVLGGKFQGKAIPLNIKRFLVGREQDCHLRPNSESVSRHHCVFTVDDFGVRVRDLGSTNGTRVNGETIRHETVLQDGDAIQIGKLQLQLSVHTVSEVPEAAVLQETLETPVDFIAPPNSAGADTMIDLPSFQVAAEQTATNLASDTAILAAGNQQAGAQQPGYPQGMGYPQGYPGYPMGMPPGYPMMPGYPPGYPPPGYPPPGYPGMQGYAGYPQMQGYPTQAAPEAVATETADDKAAASALPVRLPPPESTGAREPVPVAAPAANATPAKTEEKPSTSAADIIKSYMQRRSTR